MASNAAWLMVMRITRPIWERPAPVASYEGSGEHQLYLFMMDNNIVVLSISAGAFGQFQSERCVIGKIAEKNMEDSATSGL